jgi:hypothetical protein
MFMMVKKLPRIISNVEPTQISFQFGKPLHTNHDKKRNISA